MSEQVQQKQESPILTLTLNVDQINAVIGALGKLPTEMGVWPLRQFIAQQAQQQLQELSPKDSTDETTETNEESEQ